MESTVLVKAFGLLEATAHGENGRSLGDLAAAVGLSKPTAHRILKTLTALGYVEKSGVGQYRQTLQVRRLLAGADDRLLSDLASPVLRKLHADTEETVNLGVLRHGRILYLRVLESPQPLRRVAAPDTIDPFFCTALGRAIVGHLPEAQRDLMLRNVRLQSRTAQTIIDPEELRNIFAAVAQQGYAIEKDQTDVGVTCIGAPVFERNLPVAAISLSIPSARSTEPTEALLIDAVCAAAQEVTRRLAHYQESPQ